MSAKKKRPPANDDLVRGCVVYSLERELGEEAIVERVETLFGPGAGERAKKFIALVQSQSKKRKGDSGGKRG